MNSGGIPTKPIDSRIVLFRVFIQLAAIIGIAAIIKWFLVDTTAIHSSQMAPTLEQGDQVVYFRGITMPPLGWAMRPRASMPIIFDRITNPLLPGCLRIHALPGDSISIHQAAFINLDHPKMSVNAKIPEESLLPGEYSPRDEMTPFKIPAQGHTFSFDSLSQRDLFFAVSMMQQENPAKKYQVIATLYAGDALMKDYSIPDFSMYHGPISAIPDTLIQNWFFWDRLREYLANRFEGKIVSILFQVSDGENQVFAYTVKKDFVFLIADNWATGYDSRYFGPVCVDRIKGAVFGVLWSYGPNEKGKNAFRANRILRIVF